MVVLWERWCYKVIWSVLNLLKPLIFPSILCSLLCVLMTGCIVNSSPLSAAYMRQGTGSALVPIMACRLFGAKPLFRPMLGYCQLDHWEHTLVQILSKYKPFCPGWDELNHRGLNETADILHATFSNAHCWMEVYAFWLNVTADCSRGPNW